MWVDIEVYLARLERHNFGELLAMGTSVSRCTRSSISHLLHLIKNGPHSRITSIYANEVLELTHLCNVV